MLNDILSYQKEIDVEGEMTNGVLVVERFLQIDRSQAELVLRDLMAERMKQFEHVIATELPLLADTFDLDDDQRASLDARSRG